MSSTTYKELINHTEWVPDEGVPTASADGWAFTNSASASANKINWYFHSQDGTQHNTLPDYTGVYALLTVASVASLPSLVYYTKPLGDGNDATAWYRSSYKYSVPSGHALVAGDLVCLYTGASMPTHHPTAIKVALVLESSDGPSVVSEEIASMALTTDAAALVDEVSLVFREVITATAAGDATVILRSNLSLDPSFDENSLIDVGSVAVLLGQGTTGAVTVTTGSAGVTQMVYDHDHDGTNIDVDATFVSQGITGSASLLLEIQNLASTLQCDEFEGLGQLTEYDALLVKVTEMQDISRTLSITNMTDIVSMTTTAASIEAILSSISVLMTSVSSIDDTVVLTQIRNFLVGINRMKAAIEAFRISVVATATLQIPETITQTTALLGGAQMELECTKRFIDHFTGAAVLSDPTELASAAMSAERAADLQKGLDALELFKQMGDSTIQATDAKVQALGAQLSEISAVDFSDSLTKLQEFQANFASLIPTPVGQPLSFVYSNLVDTTGTSGGLETLFYVNSDVMLVSAGASGDVYYQVDVDSNYIYFGFGTHTPVAYASLSMFTSPAFSLDGSENLTNATPAVTGYVASSLLDTNFGTVVQVTNEAGLSALGANGIVYYKMDSGFMYFGFTNGTSVAVTALVNWGTVNFPSFVPPLP